MTTITSVMQRLRDETTELHRHAEQRPLEQGLAGGTLPRDKFVEHLAQRFLIHHALEPAVRHLCASDPRFETLIPDKLYQEQNLRADLAFFGASPERIQPLAGTRKLIADIERTAAQNPVALLGHYYVFEGSKNGASYLARRLRTAYGLERDGLRYYDPHGADQRPLWMEFKARMDAAGLTSSEADAAVTAARNAFECVAAIDDEMYPGG